MTIPMISLRHVSKSFDDKVVLKDINLDIHAGESFLIIGGSGSGKSVLLKCILGLMEPDPHSEIYINGIDVLRGSKKDVTQARQLISMLFQSNALFDSLPVWENISFLPLQLNQVSRPAAREMAKALLPKLQAARKIIKKVKAANCFLFILREFS